MSDETNRENSASQSTSKAEAETEKSSNLKKIKWYVWLLFILIVLANAAALAVDWSHDQLGAYFDSKAFEGLLIALLVPLLLSLIEQTFKIGEKIEAEKKQREQEKKDLIRQATEARRKRQIETIERTNRMWSELITLSAEVVFFKTGQPKSSIREIRKKLLCFANSAEETLNLWYLNFSENNVAQRVENSSLAGLNVLLLSAATVADAIEDAAETKSEVEAKKLQNCLLIIQCGVTTALHYPLMQIFYFAMEDKSAELSDKLNILQSCGELFRTLLKNQRPNLPDVLETKDVRNKRDEFASDYAKKCSEPKADLLRLQMQASAKDAKISTSKEFQDASKSFFEAEKATEPAWSAYYQSVIGCPADLLALSRKKIFSHEQIMRFTQEMFFFGDQMNIRNSV